MSTPRGPYLTAALLCERVIQEKDNVKSIMRIIDQVIQTGHPAQGREPPPDLVPFQYEISMFTGFKRGQAAQGEHHVEIVFVSASGARTRLIENRFRFTSDDPGEGLDMIGQLSVRIERTGLHWFEVHLNGTLITRAPLRVIYRREVATPVGDPETT
ncbi:MAG: DUF6941 family protein [bacterium]